MKSAVEHFQVDFLKEASTLLSGICRLQKSIVALRAEVSQVSTTFYVGT